jgi:hypothetical protein
MRLGSRRIVSKRLSWAAGYRAQDCVKAAWDGVVQASLSHPEKVLLGPAGFHHCGAQPWRLCQLKWR